MSPEQALLLSSRLTKQAAPAQVHGDYSAEVGDKIERPAEEIPGATDEDKAEA